MAICVSFIWDGKKEGKTEHLDLPQISVGNNEAASYGFEGYLAHDVSELVNANPWNEQIELTTLPVYKNTVELEEFIPKNYDKEKVLEKIREVAGRLGIDEHALSQVKEQPGTDRKPCPAVIYRYMKVRKPACAGWHTLRLGRTGTPPIRQSQMGRVRLFF